MISKNAKKSQKSKIRKTSNNVQNLKSNKITFFTQNSKIKQKCFLFFIVRNMQFDQNSPVQPNPEEKNPEKSGKRQKNYIFYPESF